MSDYETLLVEDDGRGIVTVTVNRPDKLNALNATVIKDLRGAATELQEREDLRAVILTGAGRAFIAGADIASMKEMSVEEAKEFGRAGHDAMDAISEIQAPVLAAVNGFALGGGLETALACDIIYASEEAKFGLPEVSLGIIPGFGGTQRLGRVVGWQRAREMVFTGDRIDADEARDIGLACAVFPGDALLDKVREVAETIASRGPLAVQTAKSVMSSGQEMDLVNGNELERNSFAKLFDSEDRREGMQAFLDRRDPEFSGE